MRTRIFFLFFSFFKNCFPRAANPSPLAPLQSYWQITPQDHGAPPRTRLGVGFLGTNIGNLYFNKLNWTKLEVKSRPLGTYEGSQQISMWFLRFLLWPKDSMHSWHWFCVSFLWAIFLGHGVPFSIGALTLSICVLTLFYPITLFFQPSGIASVCRIAIVDKITIARLCRPLARLCSSGGLAQVVHF